MEIKKVKKPLFLSLEFLDQRQLNRLELKPLFFDLLAAELSQEEPEKVPFVIIGEDLDHPHEIPYRGPLGLETLDELLSVIEQYVIPSIEYHIFVALRSSHPLNRKLQLGNPIKRPAAPSSSAHS